MPGTISARNHEITLSITDRIGTIDLGVWDTWEGGNVSADNTKHRRGGMGPQVAVGGPKTIEDVTVSRDYDLGRDHQFAHRLSNAVGRARATAKKLYLDTDGNAFGPPMVITGVLIGYNQPAGDSDSSDVAMVEVVINPDGEVG